MYRYVIDASESPTIFALLLTFADDAELTRAVHVEAKDSSDSIAVDSDSYVLRLSHLVHRKG